MKRQDTLAPVVLAGISVRFLVPWFHSDTVRLQSFGAPGHLRARSSAPIESIGDPREVWE